MPQSESVEADPAFPTCSFRGFCYHMADPGPAASPGVTCAWIRVKILGIRLSTLALYPQHDHTDVVSANWNHKPFNILCYQAEKEEFLPFIGFSFFIVWDKKKF